MIAITFFCSKLSSPVNDLTKFKIDIIPIKTDNRRPEIANNIKLLWFLLAMQLEIHGQ
jgi:hypothetical protein